MWQPKWNKNQTVLATDIHTPDMDTGSPWKCSCWELEFRDCGAIPGQGLLLTVERQIKEIVVGTACRGKQGSHGSKAILLSHT